MKLYLCLKIKFCLFYDVITLLREAVKKINGIFYDNVQISIVTYPPYLIVTKDFMTNWLFYGTNPPPRNYDKMQNQIRSKQLHIQLCQGLMFT